MTKTITRIGNSQGIIFDAALMDLAHLKVGDRLTVSLHEGGSIVPTPVRPVIGSERAAFVSVTCQSTPAAGAGGCAFCAAPVPAARVVWLTPCRGHTEAPIPAHSRV